MYTKLNKIMLYAFTKKNPINLKFNRERVSKDAIFRLQKIYF